MRQVNSLTHTNTHKLFFFGFRVKTLETAGCPAAADGDFLLVNQRREPSSSSPSQLCTLTLTAFPDVERLDLSSSFVVLMGLW